MKADPVLLQQKQAAAIVCFASLFLLVGFEFDAPLLVILVLASAAVWIRLDTVYRSRPSVAWPILSVICLPVVWLVYLLTRPQIDSHCVRCGEVMTGKNICPGCGSSSVTRGLLSRGYNFYYETMETLLKSPVTEAKQTAKHMAIASAAVFYGWPIFTMLVIRERYNAWFDIFTIVWVLSAAAYWVLVPWWVYLDAMYRRMGAAPWGFLALLTNVFGLATYLVVRSPDPLICKSCDSVLQPGLKRCPYCSADTAPVCPRCQSAVQLDWKYCPECTAPLSRVTDTASDVAAPEAPPEPQPVSLSLRGIVTDGSTGRGLEGVEVKVDSRLNPLSVTTDSSGLFEFVGLEIRPYVLIASKDGYSWQSRGCVPGTEEARNITFLLTPLPAPAT